MITISVGIDKILIAFAGKNEDGGLRIYTSSIIVYITAGQKANFKCSHTLSLTAENRATTGLLPESSNVKCRKLPKKTIKTTPASSNLIIVTLGVVIRQSITKIEYKKFQRLLHTAKT
jgi:hypothetical protein